MEPVPPERPSAFRSNRSRLWELLLPLLILMASVACGGGAERPEVGSEADPEMEAPVRDYRHAEPEGGQEAIPEELQSILDTGNEAYRDGALEEALAHFEEAVGRDPDLAAGWYGVAMVRGAMGDGEGADSAMVRVHRLAPWITGPHPAASAPANPHPSGASVPELDGDG